MKRYRILLLGSFLFVALQHLQAFSFTNYTTAQGLTHKTICCLYRDEEDFLWIGTTNGLSRFDGYGFKNFNNDEQDSLSLGTNVVGHIVEGRDNCLWLGTNAGVKYYDKLTEQFHSVQMPFAAKNMAITGITTNDEDIVWACHTDMGIIQIARTKRGFATKQLNLSAMLNTKQEIKVWRVRCYEGYLWAISSIGLIRIDYKQQVAVLINDPNHAEYSSGIKTGNSHELFIIAPYKGIYVFNTQTMRGKWLLNSLFLINGKVIPILNDVQRMPDGALWVASAPGLFRMQGSTITYFEKTTRSSHYFGGDVSTCLYLDKDTSLWIGSLNDGVFGLKHRGQYFSTFTGLGQDSSVQQPVTSLQVFANKSIIYGNTQGVFLYRYQNEVHTGSAKQIMSSATAWVFALDSLHALIATNEHLYRYDAQTTQIELLFDVQTIQCAYQDAQGVIWIGYWGGGLHGINLKTKQEYQIDINKTDKTQNIIYTLCGDADGSLWIGSFGSGLVHVGDPTSKHPHLTIYTHKKNSNSISINEVLSLHDDGRGSIWIGTCGGGLNRFDKQNKTFEVFSVKNGLKSNVIEALMTDKAGNVWFSSSVLSKYDIRNKTFSHFTSSDGITQQFSVRASGCNSKGQLFFGSNKGIVTFNPQTIALKQAANKPTLTGFRLFGLPVSPGDTVNECIPYQRSITFSDSITLPYSHHSFAIEFASMQFFETQNIQYSFMLKGIDKTWIPADGSNRVASYSGLQPGNYVFLLRASNGTTGWSEQRMLHIQIVPPWWKTWWFRVTTLLLLITGFVIIIARRIHKIHERNLKLEYLVAKRTQELEKANDVLQNQSIALHRQNENLNENQLVIEMKNQQLMEALDSKDRLIGIIGHDFKNPLNGLIGFASLLKTESTKLKLDKIERYAEHIYTSGNLLMNQMLQVLDWAQGQINDVKYKPVEINLELLLDDAILLVNQTALQKEIHLSTQLEYTSTAFVDPRMISTVFRNLLSNAIKFTPMGGTILVMMQEFDNNIDVSFIDTGVGMTSEQCNSLFGDSPSSSFGTNNEKGTGLGLQICKSFVEKNKGTIAVKSVTNEGSVFVITLPKGNEPAHQREKQNIRINTEGEQIVETLTQNSSLQTILLIDDSAQIISMLKNVFETGFRVIEAMDGQAGLQLAQHTLPDIIVCDITMPKITGIELCRILKSDDLTNHIPVLLITAQTEDEMQHRSFVSGADDFICKPFNPIVLRQKIISILGNRKKYSIHLQKQLEAVKPNETSSAFKFPESSDDKMINKTMQIINANFTNPDFDIETIADQVGVSRSQLWRKFKHTTDKNLGDYIRSLRMKKAAEMLKTGKYRISEIAYEVGFTDPKYFARCFTKEFGIAPSSFSEQNK